MLSYRHAFHAGNFADVHKHAVLTLLLQALQRKENPFCYLDTHAGAGRYDLRSEAARKNAEHEQGIARLWGRDDVPAELAPYLEAVRALNGGGALRYYPGSPRLARHFLRPQDHMALCELHSTEIDVIKREFAGDKQTAVHFLDGYQGIKALLPPAERRGLVLIDPAYERRDEFTHVVEGLRTGAQRFPQGIFAVWYPIATAAPIERFHKKIIASGLRKILVTELLTRAPASAGLNGSGLLILNPPWRIEETLNEILPWLWRALAIDGAGYARVEWLVPE